MPSVGIAIIGAGKIALANHLPGLATHPQANLVALCDNDPALLTQAAQQTHIPTTFTDYHKAIAHDQVDAVIITTPNYSHPDIVLAAIAARKHVLCEKPLALDYPTALNLYRAAEQARIRHMTAFTYRFVPAMRYMHHLVQRGDIGQPRHFRAQRFQDWGDRALGWRQNKKLAGAGELADMLSHRIDYGHLLVGPIRRLVADLRTFIPTRGGKPSDVDDWVAILAQFENSATGVLESTKLATGRGEGHHGADVVEINGTDATILYSTQRPLELLIGKKGDADLHAIDVPRQFHVYPGSKRDPTSGDPLVTFRYDQDVEFIQAILQNRPCTPSFKEGVEVQKVMDAALISHRQQRWLQLHELDSLKEQP